jgi:hypothetical protein
MKMENDQKMPANIVAAILKISGEKEVSDEEFGRLLAKTVSDEDIAKLKYRMEYKNQLFKSTIKFLSHGALEGDWNSSLFKAACDMLRHGYTEDKIIEKCEKITGNLDKKDLLTIASAIKAVERE